MPIVLNLEQRPTYWCLSVAGELGYGECSEFRLHVHHVLMARPRGAMVDLSGIEYVDSSGLGILVAMEREYAEVGGRLVIVTNATVDGLLAISRLNRVFRTAATVEEAVRVLESDDDY